MSLPTEDSAGTAETEAPDGFVSRAEYNAMVTYFREELAETQKSFAASLEELEERMTAKMEGTDDVDPKNENPKKRLTLSGIDDMSKASTASPSNPHDNASRLFHKMVSGSKVLRGGQDNKRLSTWDVPDSELIVLSHDDAFEQMGGALELEKQRNLAEELLKINLYTEKLTEQIRKMFPNHQKEKLAEPYATQPYVSDIHELYRSAATTKNEFWHFVDEFGKSTNGLTILAPLKSRSRSNMKAKFKYSDSTTKKVAWYRLTDIIRATLVYTELSRMYQACRIFFELVNGMEDIEIKEYNDRYLNPFKNGYRDIQILVAFHGHVCELQFNVEQMVHAKMSMGHNSFELLRTLQAGIKEGDVLQCRKTLDWWSHSKQSISVSEVLRSKSATGLLIEAAARGHDEIVAALLSSGADGNAKDEATGDTALHVAINEGHASTVWALLDKGNVDVTLKNDEGHTALVTGFIAQWRNTTESMARALVLLAHACGEKAILAAERVVTEEIQRRRFPSRFVVDFAEEGNVGKLISELKDFADPNSEKENGESAVVAAIKGKHFHSAEILVRTGARIDLIDKPSGQIRLAMVRRYIPRHQWKEWLPMLLAHCTLKHFKQAGFRGMEVARYFRASDNDLLAAGFSDGTIAATRFLLTRHRASECRDIGCTALDCMDAGYAATDLESMCKRIHDSKGCEKQVIISEGKYGIIEQVKENGRAVKIIYEDGTTNSNHVGDGWAYIVATPVSSLEWASC